MSDRDKYGGWTKLQFGATGFFRLERTEQRWWLVSPEGNAFLIHGLDHVDSPKIYRWYNHKHWKKELGLPEDADQPLRYKTFWNTKIQADHKYLGFNCLYSNNPPLGLDLCSYIRRARTIDNEYWRRPEPENFLDVFSDDFVEACKNTCEQMVTEGRDKDPYLLAHALTDSPILVEYESRPFPAGFYHKSLPGTTTWSVRIRNLGADAPGKKAYVELMQQRYSNDVTNFNAAYNTDFESWDTLTQTKDWRLVTDPSGNIHEERDNHAFLLAILDRAWGTQVRIIHEYDPNHLIIGDTLNLNSPLPDDIIELYAKHFSIITYQYYGATWEDHRLVLDRLRDLSGGLPAFSADSSWSVCQPPHMPDTLGPQCANYTIAAERLTEVYHASFSRPDFIGWGWCGWMDQWETEEPEKQHGGLQDAFGNWHQPLADAFKQFGRDMYACAICERTT